MVQTQNNKAGSISVTPIEHASFVIQLNGKNIYVDPVGNSSKYADLPAPDFVLITHGHPDHFAPELLEKLVSENTPIIAPEAVKEALPENLQKQTIAIKNGGEKTLMGIKIKAVPAYNLRPEALKFHPKGKGNGYVLSYAGKRIYISGDTEDVPAMRDLKDIDLAFICMNLPYTMSVAQAESAVLAFKPKKVYPYHYRGTNGFSDIHQFKKEVEEKDSDINVVLLNWYPGMDNNQIQ